MTTETAALVDQIELHLDELLDTYGDYLASGDGRTLEHAREREQSVRLALAFLVVVDPSHQDLAEQWTMLLDMVGEDVDEVQSGTA